MDQIIDQTNTVGVITKQLTVINFDGVDCAGPFGPLAASIDKLPGLPFKRHGNVETFSTTGNKVTDRLFETAGIDLYRAIVNRLSGLRGKQTVYAG